MPFVVTTTHTIPDNASVTADMLSDVLRPSRWAGLPDGTASTARVDFVPALPVAPSPSLTKRAERERAFDEYMAAREVELKPGTVNHLPPGEPASFRHPRDPVRRFRG